MILFRPLMRYADFKGRASRSEFWLFAMLQTALYVVLAIAALTSLTRINDGGNGWGAVMALGLIGIAVVALILPNLALLGRRLHDTGRSAIWLCLMIPSALSQGMTFQMVKGMAQSYVAMPGLGTADPMTEAMAAAMHLGVIAVLAGICQCILFVLTLLPGTRGENRFGPDPRDPTTRYSSGGGGTVYDDDRLEALFAEAKRANAGAEQPYAPVFDFGPGPARPEAVQRAPVDWGTPAAAARPFGRRGT